MVEDVKSYSGEYRRRQILGVALRLFLANGYAGTPMSAIASEVGVSKAGLYHHFKNKDEVLRSLYLPAFAKIEALLDEGCEWRELLEKYLEIMLENRGLLALMMADLSVASRPGVGERREAMDHRLLVALTGEGATLTNRMRGECALGALRSAVMGFPDADDATVREVGLEAAEAVLGLP